MWSRRALVLILSAILARPVAATECRLENAFYTQHQSSWSLRFSPVPRDAAANQTARFVLVTPGAPDGLPGGIWQPNGFTQSLGIVSDVCPEDEQGIEPCLIWQGGAYALAEAGIVVFPGEVDVQAPRQVLLPGLASSIWYSMRRGSDFVTDNLEGDVFTLSSCAD